MQFRPLLNFIHSASEILTPFSSPGSNQAISCNTPSSGVTIYMANIMVVSNHIWDRIQGRQSQTWVSDSGPKFNGAERGIFSLFTRKWAFSICVHLHLGAPASFICNVTIQTLNDFTLVNIFFQVNNPVLLSPFDLSYCISYSAILCVASIISWYASRLSGFNEDSFE